ncbi:MAG: CoA-disulfide reductase, partial [Opitutaceae bacterium]|nr:CoA-disulfide reductase [Opitutaceae bacterium]
MIEQAPALILLFPFFASIIVALAGIRVQSVCFPLTVISLVASVLSSVSVLVRVVNDGVIRYRLGGWEPPMGIEFRIDSLGALVALTVSIAGLLTAIYSKRQVPAESPDKVSQYYTLYLLLMTGLLGMVITGDAFNLFVLIEVSALTSYALIAMGPSRATLAAYKYVIM